MKERMMQRIRSFIRHITGRASAQRADDATRRTEAAEAALRGVPPEARERLAQRLRRELADVAAPALLLAVAVLALPGCNALAGLLRTDTGAAAPVNQATSHGVAALPGSTVIILGGRQDAAGDVGASGATRASGTASQSTAVDPAAVADGAAKLLASVPAGSPASALARAAAATAKKDPEAAAELLEAAKDEAAKAKPAPKPTPAAPEAPPPGPAPAPPPTSPLVPIVDPAAAEPAR